MIGRWTMMGLGCLLILSLFGAPRQLATAQGKKGSDDLLRARQRIEQLERQLRDKEQRLDLLQAQLKRLKGDDKQDDQKILQLQKQLKEKEQRLDQLQAELKKRGTDEDKEMNKLRQQVKELEGVKKAVFVHVRHYRLKSGGNEEQVQALADDINKTLGKLVGVRGLWVGRPENPGNFEPSQPKYHLSVVVLLDGADALAELLGNPQHRKLASRLEKSCDKPTVHDFQSKRE